MSDMLLKQCFFCGEINQVVLEEHHIVPRAVEKTLSNNNQTLKETRTVFLCRNCHKKLHYLSNVAEELMQKVIQTPEIEQSQLELELSQIAISHREDLDEALEVLRVLSNLTPTVEKSRLILELVGHGWSTQKAEEIIKDLEKGGTIYSPREGCLKKT